MANDVSTNELAHVCELVFLQRVYSASECEHFFVCTHSQTCDSYVPMDVCTCTHASAQAYASGHADTHVEACVYMHIKHVHICTHVCAGARTHSHTCTHRYKKTHCNQEMKLLKELKTGKHTIDTC